MNIERFKTTKTDIAGSALYLLGLTGLGNIAYQSLEAYDARQELKTEVQELRIGDSTQPTTPMDDDERRKYISLMFETQPGNLLSIPKELTADQHMQLEEAHTQLGEYNEHFKMAVGTFVLLLPIVAFGVKGMIEENREKSQTSNITQ